MVKHLRFGADRTSSAQTLEDLLGWEWSGEMQGEGDTQGSVDPRGGRQDSMGPRGQR